MLFTSYSFIFFSGIVVFLYYTVFKRRQWQFLLFASYLFYYFVRPIYLLYIMATTVTVWFTAIKIQQKKHNKEKKKQFRLMMFCILLNIGILAVVKYTNFTIANLNVLFNLFRVSKKMSFVNLIVPMGISFYTFRSVGYLIDVYYGKYCAEKSLFKFALFVSFFPQLVQGPISRFDDLSQSLFQSHKAERETISFGIERILWGFFKKLVIADRIFPAVNLISDNTTTYKGVFVFVGMMFYALQLYADFTGGIDITIGVAQMLGIRIAENFERPYFSKSVKEYWRRWHITMGTWFKDYIFYPVSVCKPMLKANKFFRKHFGGRIGRSISLWIATFIVWFTTGIWHGASWNYIAWGIGNFLILMISQEADLFYKRFHKKFHLKNRWYFRLFQIMRTIFLMSCLRMFDCYKNVSTTFKMFGSMFADFNIWDLNKKAFLDLGLSGYDYLILLSGLAIMTVVSLLQRKGSVRKQIMNCKFPVRFLIWYGLFLAILIFGAYGVGYDVSQFIYNRF